MTTVRFQSAIFRTRCKFIRGVRTFETGFPRAVQVRAFVLPTHENLFADFFLSSPTALWRNIFLLTLTALTKVFFTAWTFGMMVGDSSRTSLPLITETPRFLLEFSYRRLRLELAWGGPWDSSRKPKGWVQLLFTD